jgi:hypothetical protein
MRKYRPAQMLLSIGPSWQMGTANVVLGKSNGAREGKVPSVGQIIVKGGKKKGTTLSTIRDQSRE